MVSMTAFCVGNQSSILTPQFLQTEAERNCLIPNVAVLSGLVETKKINMHIKPVGQFTAPMGALKNLIVPLFLRVYICSLGWFEP